MTATCIFAIPPDAIAKFLLKVTRQDDKSIGLQRDWIKSDSTKLDWHSFVSFKNGIATLGDKSGKQTAVTITEFSPGDKALLEMIAADK